MSVKFTSPLEHKPCIISGILKRSYAELVSSDPKHCGQEVTKWEEFDKEVFQNPDTVGTCVFLTWSDNQLVGFGSYDPRQRPESGIIGHNCILPEFRGRGFGKQQILEILQRFRSVSIKMAKAATCTHSFFVPAQRMYISCGFVETGRHPFDLDPFQEMIEYEKRIYNESIQCAR